MHGTGYLLIYHVGKSTSSMDPMVCVEYQEYFSMKIMIILSHQLFFAIGKTYDSLWIQMRGIIVRIVCIGLLSPFSVMVANEDL